MVPDRKIVPEIFLGRKKAKERINILPRTKSRKSNSEAFHAYTAPDIPEDAVEVRNIFFLTIENSIPKDERFEENFFTV